MQSLVTTAHPAAGVALVTVSHPALDNQGSWEAIELLCAALEAQRVRGTAVVVIASGVPGRWLSHAYLADLVNTFQGKPTTGDPLCWARLLEAILAPGLVCMAAVSGTAAGGGAEIAWACDLRIAETSASFSQPEVLLGLPPGLGGSSRLARLAGRSIAAEMVLSGAPLGAERLHQVGVVNRLCAPGSVQHHALEWATEIAAGGAQVLRAIKQQLVHADELPLPDALEHEQQLLQRFAAMPATQARLAAVQARYDAGESMEQILAASARQHAVDPSD